MITLEDIRDYNLGNIEVTSKSKLSETDPTKFVVTTPDDSTKKRKYKVNLNSDVKHIYLTENNIEKGWLYG